MRKQPKQLARIRLRIVVCVLVGLLISLLTAFVPAFIGNVDQVGWESTQFVIENPNPPAYLGDLTPEFRVAIWCGLSEPQYQWQNWLNPSISFNEYHYGEQYTKWDRSVHGDVPPGFTVRRGSFGFPFKCMYHDELSVASGAGPYTLEFLDNCIAQSGLRLGIPISGVKSPAADRYLPLAPHWGGLLLNVLLYGGALALVIVLPAFIQRAHRVRHHLCLWCGYSTGDLEQCPECGATTTDQAAA
ncbi:MAG: hypothetical protein ACSHX5_05570 [Phycisphaerales bacterium]